MLYLVWQKPNDEKRYTNAQINSALDDQSLLVGTVDSVPVEGRAELLSLLCAPEEQTDPITYIAGLLQRAPEDVKKLVLVYTLKAHTFSLN